MESRLASTSQARADLAVSDGGPGLSGRRPGRPPQVSRFHHSQRNRSRPGANSGTDIYVGAKGFRSVWIYVKRGTETLLWDGKRRLLPGDRLRLKVDPGSYQRVAVYAGSASPTLLYSGKLTPGQNLTLPDAWEIDDSLNDEQLFVVFSEGPVEPVWNEWRLGRVPPGVAVLPFTLPKAGSDAGSFGP